MARPSKPNTLVEVNYKRVLGGPRPRHRGAAPPVSCHRAGGGAQEETGWELDGRFGGNRLCWALELTLPSHTEWAGPERAPDPHTAAGRSFVMQISANPVNRACPQAKVMLEGH